MGNYSIRYLKPFFKKLPLGIWWRVCFVFSPILLLGNSTPSKNTIIINHSKENSILTNNISICIDSIITNKKNKQITPHCQTWTPLKIEAIINTGATYWLQFELWNQSSNDTLILKFGKFDKIELYKEIENSDNLQLINKAGFLTDFNDRAHPLDELAIPIYIPRGQKQSYFVRVENKVRKFENELTVVLKTPIAHRLEVSESFSTTRNFDLFYAFFLGGIFVFFIYSMSQYVQQKQHEGQFTQNSDGVQFEGRRSTAKAYLLYSLYLLGVFFYYLRLAEAGNSLYIFFTHKMSLYYYLESPLGLLTIFFYIHFLHAFLDLKNRSARLSSLFLISSYGVLLGIVFGLLCELSFGLRLSYAFYFWIRVIGIIVALIAIFWVIQIKDFFVKVVIIGSLILIAGGLASILWFYVASDYDFSTFNDILFFNQRILCRLPLLPMQVGIFVEVVFYAWALSYLTKQVLDEGGKAKKELELAKEKEQFYDGITHNFRTPITNIVFAAKDAEKAFEQRQEVNHQRAIKLIKGENYELLRLVNALLDLAKIKAQALETHYISGNMVHFLRYITHQFDSYAEQQHVKLAYYAEETTILMDYDRDKTRNILANLIHNAIKFTPEGGAVTIHIKKEVAKKTEQLCIKVQDTGIGIKPEDIPKLFKPFSQLNPSDNVAPSGTGLGLVHVHKLADLLGGEVEVKSKLGEGSTFTVRLPIHHTISTSTAETYQNTEVEEWVTAKPNLQVDDDLETDENIPLLLIVEDNKELALAYKQILTKAYRFIFAHDGETGVEKAKRHLPDVVISDVMMPKKMGYELCEALKTDKTTNHIPIILVTAKAREEDKLYALKRADYYLSKPFNEEELNLVLGNLLQQKSYWQQRYRNFEPLEPASDETTKYQDEWILSVQQIIEANFNNSDWGRPEFSRAMNMSESSLARKLNVLTRFSPTDYIRSYRLDKAKELLVTTNNTIAEICEMVGFNNLQYFTRAYREKFGMPPGEHRNLLKNNQ